ncbi:hypothetical protein [Thalassolituus oleivorans]|uniref:hypothetical protein n=1 Tax=Thalassolituus oleivorans TaxID=187493 RepID=UPI0023F2656C|nr:hypothetical protein [Thalassolituus oleivorans]
MTGALNLSLRPLSSAMQSMAVKREGFISRYFCAKNGVADYYQLLEPAVISAGTDFEIEFSCSLNNLTVDSCIVGYKTTNLGALLIYHDAPDGWRVLYYNGTVLTSWSTGIITSNSKLTTYSAVFSGDSVTFSNGSSSATGTLNGLGSVDIYFDLIGNQINTKLLDGIVSNLKLWRGGDRITGQLTDWYKFDTPNSFYQRNHAVPQGVELQSSILGEDFGGFTPESSNGQITIVGDEFRAAKISNNGPANIKRVITLEAGKTYKITVQHSSAELGIRGMAVGSPNDGSGSAKWDYYSGWIYSDSNGRSELVVTLDYNNIWLYLSSGLTVGSYIGYSNVSIQEWSGAEIIGGMPEDWFKVERQPHWNYWLKPEIVTQSLWENPSSYADQWSYNPENNKWTYLGDGSLSALQLLASADQPEKMLISGVAERISGSGFLSLCASIVDEYAVSDSQFLAGNPFYYNVVMDKSLGGGQQFKRRSGILSVEISKPSFREIMEIAE